MCRSLAAATIGIVLLIVSGGLRGERVLAAPGAHELSLADAVRAALANDAELYIAREDLRAAADGIVIGPLVPLQASAPHAANRPTQ